MKFRNDDFQPVKKSDSELSDMVDAEHPGRVAMVAEQQIREMHHHDDGSVVELHQVGSQEFIRQSIASSIEGRISDDSGTFLQKQEDNALSAAKVEYERKAAQGSQQLYGVQQQAVGSRHETVMMGCNCGAEWTVTGQSMKNSGPDGVKVEQYSPAAQPSGYIASSGPGTEYASGGSQDSSYRG